MSIRRTFDIPISIWLRGGALVNTDITFTAPFDDYEAALALMRQHVKDVFAVSSTPITISHVFYSSLDAKHLDDLVILQPTEIAAFRGWFPSRDEWDRLEEEDKT
jgi:hypothetical protein